MIHTIIRGYVVAATVVAVVGCSVDPVRLTDQRSARADVALETASADPERAALRTLTRAVAMALGDSISRSALKAALRGAPFREHKLEFRKYLSSAVLEHMSQRSGESSQSLAAALAAVRPLEFYMPVAAHRARWTGGADLLVVSQLLDRDPIVAFNLNGEEVTVSRQVVPSVPMLSIVSMETRFDTPLDIGKWQNVDDMDGRAIGTLAPCGAGQAGCASSSPAVRTVMDCGDNCGGDGGGGGSYTPGLYMTFSRIEDRSEDFTRGDPEIEVHVQGPVAAGDPQYGADLACSGEHALPERTFDQNLAFWNGSVLIWSTAEADNFNAQFGDGHHVLFWEDDDTPCVIKLNHNTVYNFIAQTVATVGAAALKKAGSGGVGLAFVAATFLASAFQNASWLLSDDDFLGALVTESSHGDYWSDANYTLLKGSTNNGRANIVGK
jgi:hypothetical protein